MAPGTGAEFLRVTVEALPKVRRRILREMGAEIRDELKRRIEQQEIRPFNKPKTTERKKKEGKDPRTLIASRGYLNSIRLRVKDDGTVKVSADGKHKETGEAYERIAYRHEYGDKVLVPRPHWYPTGTWAQRELMPEYSRRYYVEGIRIAAEKVRIKPEEM